jgi:hypothetical protein
MIERVEPLTDFRFELAGILCTAEYEVIEGRPMGRSYITEDGRPRVHFELEEDDFKEVVLDSDAIPWRT